MRPFSQIQYDSTSIMRPPYSSNDFIPTPPSPNCTDKVKSISQSEKQRSILENVTDACFSYSHV